jgi:hypothetical protein
VKKGKRLGDSLVGRKVG